MSTDRPSGGEALSRATLIVALFAAAAGIWFGIRYFGAGLEQRPHMIALQAGTLLPQPKALAPFALTDQDGAPLTSEGLHGHWTFVAFGYTVCPDVCPILMATFNAVDRQLTSAGTPPPADFLFVSVDPERDSPERLAQYVRYFNPRFLGATGSHGELRKLTRDVGVLYQRVDNQDTAMGYLVDHSASILLLDPQARLVAIFSPPHDARAMAEDFAAITADDRNRP